VDKAIAHRLAAELAKEKKEIADLKAAGMNNLLHAPA
jgi:hypothetical protein